MSTIKDNLYFTYDGKSCKDFGLINISLDNGMFEESFGATRSIVETEVQGGDTPTLNRIDEEPLEFPLTIAFEGKFDDNLIDEVIVWLFKDYYRPLYFENSPNKIYYCMPVGEASIVHNGLKEGFITVSMRCKSSRVMSPVFTTETYDFSSGTGSLSISNEGHFEIYPELSIVKIGDGHVTITKNGEIFEVRDLTNLEEIYIDSRKELIESDIVGVYRYDNVVGDFHDLAMDLGNNTYNIQGSCKISFRYSFKYRF